MNESILDLHFLYDEDIAKYYSKIEQDSHFLDKAIEACEKQIAISSKSAKAFRKMGGGIIRDLPMHRGFKQLTIIKEKQGKYEEAIKLAEKAKKEGWGKTVNEDWDKRISRCNKKMLNGVF